MRTAVPRHPLCTNLAAAHRHAGTLPHRIISICLGHLDDAALTAAAHALRAAHCITGPTINDSLFLLTRSPLTPPDTLRHAMAAREEWMPH